MLPRRWNNGVAKGWDLGIFGTMAISAFVAVIADYTPITAAISAIAAPEIIERWILRQKIKEE
jgi:hypothetical protein